MIAGFTLGFAPAHYFISTEVAVALGIAGLFAALSLHGYIYTGENEKADDEST